MISKNMCSSDLSASIQWCLVFSLSGLHHLHLLCSPKTWQICYLWFKRSEEPVSGNPESEAMDSGFIKPYQLFTINQNDQFFTIPLSSALWPAPFPWWPIWMVRVCLLSLEASIPVVRGARSWRGGRHRMEQCLSRPRDPLLGPLTNEKAEGSHEEDRESFLLKLLHLNWKMSTRVSSVSGFLCWKVLLDQECLPSCSVSHALHL